MFHWPIKLGKKVSDQFGRTLGRRLERMQSKFETLLQMDLDHHDEEIQRRRAQFEVCRDESLIRGLTVELPETESDRVLVLFSRMSLFFEIGVYFEKNENEWFTPLSFLYGQFRSMNRSTTYNWAPIGPAEVLISEHAHLWEKLEIYPWIQNQNFSSLRLQLNENQSLVLFSSLAGPWLKDHFEKIHREILKSS